MLLDGHIKRGQDFLGTGYPIICGAMTWVSDHKLVAAVAEADAFGQLAGGNAPPVLLREEIIKTSELTEIPFGVNLITIAPNYRDQLNMVCEMKMPVVIFAGSIPRGPEIQRAKDSGAKVLCFAPTEMLARKLIDLGADGLILEGSEAGGHIGPVALSVLLQQILFKISDTPIFVAGGIATGRMMAHLLMMGAAGVQLGTRFVMSEECNVHANFKEAFRRAKARDALATPQFDSRLPVIPVRALRNDGSVEFKKLQLELLHKLDSGEITRVQAQEEVERFWVGALRIAAVDGNIKQGSLMAGQSVGLVDEIKPLKGIIRELVDDAEETLELIHKQLHAADRT